MRYATKVTALAVAGILGCSSSGGGEGEDSASGDSDGAGADGTTDGDGDGDAGSGGGGDDGSGDGGDDGGDSGETGGSGDDGATGSGGDLPDCDFDPGLTFDPYGLVLQFESADENTCVRIERDDQGPGDMANTSYGLVEAQVGPLGAVSLIKDEDSKCYWSSHHNQRDIVHAWTDTRHYDVKLFLDTLSNEWTYTLYVFEKTPPKTAEECREDFENPDDAGQIGDPIELFPVNP